ncbi:MAG: hypothetical protein ABR562_09710, partial [Thermoplasmatota archaeon]
MPDVEKILKLVSEGALTPEEADEILNALSAAGGGAAAADQAAQSNPSAQPQ